MSSFTRKNGLFAFIALIFIMGSFYSVGGSTGMGESKPPIQYQSFEQFPTFFQETMNSMDQTLGMKIGVMTWNLAERSPSFLDCQFLREFQQQSCDVIALGIQECENIKPRRREGRRSRKWRRFISKTLNPLGYEIFTHHKLGGLQLTLLVNSKAKERIDGVQTIEVPCGIGNVLPNKGAIVMLLRVEGKTIAFINSHLAAHHNKVKARNEDFHRIVETVIDKAHRKWMYLLRSKVRSPVPSIDASEVNDGSPLINVADDILSSFNDSQPVSTRQKQKKIKSRISKSSFSRKRFIRKIGKRRVKKRSVDSLMKEKAIKPKFLSHLFDAVFFFGDLNYRIDLPRLEIESLCEAYATVEERPIEIPPASIKIKSRSDKIDPARVIMIRRKILKDQSNNPVFNRIYYQNLPEDLDEILRNDQLVTQILQKKAFENFKEGSILFPPTFKYDKGSDSFDTSIKARCPAWTDRILFSVRNSQGIDSNLKRDGEEYFKAQTDSDLLEVKVLDYYSLDVRSSDHRPVCGIYQSIFKN